MPIMDKQRCHLFQGAADDYSLSDISFQQVSV
jgi:hypothetical protein